MAGRTTPTTVAEAVEWLRSKLNDNDRRYMAGLNDNELWMLHHGYGTAIRNKFMLWQDNEALLRDAGYTDMSPEQRHEAADGASHKIIVALRDRLREEYPSE